MRYIECFAITIAITLNVPQVQASFCVETEDPSTECSGTVGPQLAGELAGWINLDGEVIVETMGVEEPLRIAGLELQSTGSYLQPREMPTPTPFLFRLSDTSSRITFGKLGPGEPMELSWASETKYDLNASLNSYGPGDDLILAGGPMSTRRISFCTLAGDTNFDGSVTFPLSGNFGKQNSVWPEGDFDFDRTVGFSDFLSLSENFGQTLPELAANEVNLQSARYVPEPRSFVSVCIACLLLVAARRREAG